MKKHISSEIEGIRHSIAHLKGDLIETEIHIDRYLPCKILNMIRDLTEDSISDYMGRKEFCERVKARFDALKLKIKIEEKHDVKEKQIKLHMNSLKKREYVIPEIEVPPTLSSEEEEESEEESESDDGDQDDDAPEAENGRRYATK